MRPVDRIPKIPSIPLLISFPSVECNTSIIAASIRSMRPLFILLERSGFSSNTQSEKKGYYIGQESGHLLQTFIDEHASGLTKDSTIITTHSLSGKPTVHDSLSKKRFAPLPNSQNITKTTDLRVLRGSPDHDARRSGMGWAVGGEAALLERRIEDRV